MNMKRPFLSRFVVAMCLPCIIVGFSSCTNEDLLRGMNLPDGESEMDARTRAISYSPYKKYTFVLHADNLQDGFNQSSRIADLYDIGIIISPIAAGNSFDECFCSIEFRTHPDGFPPDNYIEFRNHECHSDPTQIRPCISGPVNMVIANSVSATDVPLTEWQFNNSVVAVRLTKKGYITDMNYKPRLIISKKPLSELVTSGNSYDEVCIHIYYNCNDEYYYDAIEYNESNPPTEIFNPGNPNEGGTIRYLDGTETCYYVLRTKPLPEYDMESYNISKWVYDLEELRTDPTKWNLTDYEHLLPYKNYYKTPYVVPQWYK